MSKPEDPVLHVVVVGFHHKKGCQVEYSYPPLIPGNPVDSSELPAEWKHLPSLALPDGAHNYVEDTIFFHLPSRTEQKTIYGISCYRQIDASELVNRGTDVTRNTVQKSVCVLSRLPLYGLIQAKLELITHAYFRELDFSQVSLLEDTFSRLNSSLEPRLLKGSQAYLGLSARSLVQQFKHKVIVLFKLMMLERRVLFYSSPASPICSTILSVITLFPGMIESGLTESASHQPKKKLSQTMKVTSVGSDLEDYLEVHYKSDSQSEGEPSTDHSQMDSPEGLASVHTSGKCATNNVMHPRHFSTPEPKSQSSQNNVTHSRSVKSESSAVEYGRQTSTSSEPSDLIAQACDVPVSIDSITHIERVQSKVGLQNDEIILEDSKRQTEKTNPLQFVEDITHVQPVQKQSSSSSLGDVGSPELATEATDMEELLDTDECFSWEDSKGKLQIDTPVEDSSESVTFGEDEESSDHKPKLQNLEGFDDVNLDGESDKSGKSPGDKMLRNDSVDSQSSVRSASSTASNLSAAAYMLKNRISSALWPEEEENKLEMNVMRPVSPTPLPVDTLGLPLAIFSKGVLCHPYLSLQYYDLLQDVNVRGFIVGATNVLFRQKHNLLDIIVDISEGKILIHDQELRKQLNLTTADLRFADYIVGQVAEDKGDIFLDDTEWEGGEEWLREQFRIYLVSLLCTLHFEEEKLLEDFGSPFVSAWKTTYNYKQWQSEEHLGLSETDVGHPFHGQLSMADMRLKFSHTLSNSDKGKKVNAAMDQAGKAMVQTGKAVGGAFTSAKSAMSSWFTFNKNAKPSNAADTTTSDDVGGET